MLNPIVGPDELQQRLSQLPRLSLADLPTPLLECPRLSKALDGPRILVKRDDQTGLAFGGNKVREFEYSVAPAVEGGYDLLLHGSTSQSNQSRLTAALAARLGLKAAMVGERDEYAEPVNGNLLLTHLFGADVHLVDGPEEKETVIESLKAEGHRIYNTSTDGYFLRSISYVGGFLELWEQLQNLDVQPDAIYVSSGVHTHVGLTVAAKALGICTRIVGISPIPRNDSQSNANFADVANEVSRLLNLDLTFSASDFESYGEYAGEGYGIVTSEGHEAMILAARTEGLVLDPIYTAKTLAAMIHHIRVGQFTDKHAVVFVHTGGTPALFAYANEILDTTPIT